MKLKKVYCCYLLCLQLWVTWAVIEPMPDWDSSPHPCDRPCDEYTSPMTCEYNFIIEWFLTLSKACHNCPFVESDCSRPHCITGDGLRRAVISTNRKMPGPEIKVCHNDRVIMHVHNELETGEGTTIHMHGIHQKGTPYMDGANLVTQCPIPQKGGFTYNFTADPPGTHFWHSHTGHQRSDGLQGAFIVHEYNNKNPHYHQYDHDCDTESRECEYSVLLSDWLSEFGISHFLKENLHAFEPSAKISAIMNGKNRNYDVTDYRDGTSLAKTPWEVFKVEAGKTYRFRVINGANLVCPFKVATQGHQMTIIAADGHPVEPEDVDYFYITPGERYDFLVTMNQPEGNYWLQAFGTNQCGFTPANVFGIIRYSGAPESEPTANRLQQPTGKTLNIPPEEGPPPGALASDELLIYQLRSTDGEDLSSQKVDYRMIVGLDFISNDNVRFNHREFYPVQELSQVRLHQTPNINNITLLIPSAPVLSQPDAVTSDMICNRHTLDMDKCFTEGCVCVNLEKVDLPQIVEVVLVNEGSASPLGHPMHIHGYSFRVISSGKLGESTKVADVLEKWDSGELPRNMVAPSYRDTVWVPDGGFVIARFEANNPGFWLIHCHIEGHVEQGQGMIVQVGERTDLPPVPEDFPRCGYWPKKKQHKPPIESGAHWLHAASHIIVTVILLLNSLLFAIY